MVDDPSRVAYGEVLDSERKEEVVATLVRVVAFLERQRVKIGQLMTDNDSAYCSKLFRRKLEALGIRHLLTRPYTPKTNGKVDRLIRRSVEECAYGRPSQTSKERTGALGA